MSRLIIVVESAQDWAPYFPSERVITFDDYLQLPAQPGTRTRVINLCRKFGYLSKGYYCSLLAEARGHSVIPSVKTLNDLRNRRSFAVIQEQLHSQSEKLLKKLASHTDQRLDFWIFLGESSVPELQKLARELFDQHPCPLLRVQLEWEDGWRISALKISPLHALDDNAQEHFANALDRFSAQLWRNPKKRKPSRYDMAILVDKDEKLPPSDPKALKKFVRAGEKLGIDVDFIGRKDIRRLPEYDMLFIRETTNIDHHTFEFACRAETEGLVVMDDPQSIIRCTNKVYLADLFGNRKVPTPKTRLLSNSTPALLDSIAEELGLPLILKIPDGSFSRGMVKVEDRAELDSAVNSLLKHSALLLAQEFLYTEYDWRIGVLNGKPLYACKYFMARNHWQIYDHSQSGDPSGSYQTMPTYEAPKAVVNTAIKAASLIGNGLYGVDLKQAGKRVVVIEVNDNPSIDAGVEDEFIGDELYQMIMQEFINRVEQKRRVREDR
ncbi:RimK family protein [Marinimicrobium alkaliphilum]|uniref:RimK family protein n=1 Tax=Marinimicrobium alkaliphilum TaxID=2202654 RepID=UPI000DB9F8AF|nr:RimK family protein [Marinimicrobium alkaliphilum]